MSSSVAIGWSKSTSDRSTRSLLSATNRTFERTATVEWHRWLVQLVAISFQLGAHLAALGPAGAGVRGALAVIGLFMLAMRLCHDDFLILCWNSPTYHFRRDLRRQTPARRRSASAKAKAFDIRPA